MGVEIIGGYPVDLERLYESQTHVWVQPLEDRRVRIGLDPLGLETMGDVVRLDLVEVGSVLATGQAFGMVEAAKFVGPLQTPVAGIVRARNSEALEDPTVLTADPYGRGWLVELEISDLTELDKLLRSPDEIRMWFRQKVAEYRERGILAE